MQPGIGCRSFGAIMKPERWVELEKLYHEIVNLDPAERDQRLSAVPDLELRREALSLVQAGSLSSNIAVWLKEERGRVLVQQAAAAAARQDTAATRSKIISTAHAFKLGDLLAERYRIVAILGQGGMGEVYEAEDRDLHEHVALKVISSQAGVNATWVDRFRREVQLARRVTHPNVCRVFDLQHHRQGSQDLIFLTMELVRGETLAARLKRIGRLCIADALPVAVQLCAALEAAHHAGVLHRDFKSGNVMLVESGQQVRAVVTDFGTALPMDSAHSSIHTTTGAIVGTPAYMSPEQLAGKELTPASDIYSLGLVLYEMVTGKRPFQSDSAWTEAMKRLSEDPEPPSSIAREIGETWNSTILRCVEREPAKRFSSAQEVSDCLQGLQRLPHRLSRDLSSIAVLPFTNLSGNPSDEYFSDGMSEEIINALSHLEGLRVAARTSSFSFKGRAVEITEIARKLGVETLLEGSVRKLGNRIRITAQLVNVADGFHLWSERYDREMQDIFAVQDEIACSIAGRLKVTLKGGQQMLVRAGTDNLEAYELYLKGRALAYQRGQGLPHAREYFERAVALDAKYALAWAELAYTCFMLAWFGFLPPQATFPQTREAAIRAAALDPSLAEAHGALGCLYLCNWDWSNAEREFLHALELNPRYVMALNWYCRWLQSIAGRFEEGLAYARQAAELDPLSVSVISNLAYANLVAGRSAEALVAAQNAIKLDPQSIFAHLVLTDSLFAQGQLQESIAVCESALGKFGRYPWFMAFLTLAYADCGKPEQARAAYNEILARARWEYVQPMLLASSAASLGELDEAIRYAREAYAIHDPMLFTIGKRSIGMKSGTGRLHEDHRFREILDSMGL